jgi:Cdc6-like AAA superfamily ATPase
MDRWKPEQILQAFQEFVQRCLIGQSSLILPERQAWTFANTSSVKRRLVDNPQLQELTFEEKLQLQMENASSDEWLVLADAHFVYYLISGSMKAETKLKQIKWLAEQGGFRLPPDDAPVWIPLKHGITHTGQRYHLRYLQLWLILMFAEALKKESNLEEKLQDGMYVQNLLDNLLKSIPSSRDRAYDMRHTLLFLMFPNSYESIISTSDKEKIVEAFKDRIKGPVPSDLDEALYRIREVLTPEYDKDGRRFTFYDEPLNFWKHSKAPVALSPNTTGSTETIVPIKKLASLPPETTEILSTLQRTRNIILYGPPGTGKTFVAEKVIREILKPQSERKPTEGIKIQATIEGLTFYDVLAISMYIAGNNKPYNVRELLEQDLIKAYFQTRTVKEPQRSIWGYLQTYTNPNSQTVKVTRRSEPYLFDKTDDSLWYLTDDGKKYVETELAHQLQMLRGKTEPQSEERFIERVTFHQSFSYEDFIEGWRPVIDDEGNVKYEVIAGILRRIALKADADPSNKYVLLIDEINRGNIAKIFGELITLLEDDKRKVMENVMSITLPYSGHRFSLPANLYIIGTMNTADRSIALLDVALRRRFAFLEMKPHPHLIEDNVTISEEVSLNLSAILTALNRGIAKHLDKNYQIGHSYFLKVSKADAFERLEALEYVWNYQIIPLLEEYFYSQPEVIAELLKGFVDLEDDHKGIEKLRGEDLLFALERLIQDWADIPDREDK